MVEDARSRLGKFQVFHHPWNNSVKLYRIKPPEYFLCMQLHLIYTPLHYPEFCFKFETVDIKEPSVYPPCFFQYYHIIPNSNCLYFTHMQKGCKPVLTFLIKLLHAPYIQYRTVYIKELVPDFRYFMYSNPSFLRNALARAN